MENPRTFATTTGYCHITDTHIILTKSEALGDFQAAPQSKAKLFLNIYCLIGLFLCYRSFREVQRQDYVMGILYGLVGVILLYVVIKSRINSSEISIPRTAVDGITFREARAGFKAASFELLFRNKNGQSRKRVIILPASLPDGHDPNADALKVMRAENLVS